MAASDEILTQRALHRRVSLPDHFVDPVIIEQASRFDEVTGALRVWQAHS